MLFAVDNAVSKWSVFFAASAALIVATAVGVLAGSLLSQYLSELLGRIAGVGFILVGVWALWQA